MGPAWLRQAAAAALTASALLGAQSRAQPVTDDRGRALSVTPAAQRVVSLAPHATDFVVTLGAAERLVAVDPHSDAVGLPLRLTRIAAYPHPDPERLLAASPDLVLLWGEGLSPGTLARLEQLGLRVFVSQPDSLEAVADSLARIGRLLGTPARGMEAAARFRERADALSRRYASLEKVSVFVQIWDLPLITIGEHSVMADAIGRCGASNAAAGIAGSAPRLSAETVIRLRPALIVSTIRQGNEARWRSLGVVGETSGAARFLSFNDAAIERPSPPILDALEKLCALIDAYRPVRAQAQPGR